MHHDDMDRVRAQEKALVFSRFDEQTAFRIGSAIRERGLVENWPIMAEVRLWDRPLFFAALPGSTASNVDWMRRKFNVVRMFHRSTYGLVLEERSPDRQFKVGTGLPITDYVLAGGGFPIRIEGAGVIGAVLVSGLPERQDHAVVVEALCGELGLAYGDMALED